MFQHSLRNLNRNNLWFLANANTDSKLKINVLKSKYNCKYFETLTKIQYMVFFYYLLEVSSFRIFLEFALAQAAIRHFARILFDISFRK